MLSFQIVLALWLCLISRQGLASELVVIVHPSNPVKNISASKAANLFLIPGATWSDGSPVIPIDLRQPTAPRSDFYLTVSGKNSSLIKTYWARAIFTGTGYPPAEFNTTADVVKYVSETPGAIGYIPKESLTEQVKVVLNIHQ